MEFYEKYEATLKSKFGFSYLKPYQELVIRRIDEAKEKDEHLDLLVTLPTGEGKSILFMLPAATSDDYMVIIYPLLSLMNDQAERFRKANINAEMLKGGMTREERNETLNRLKLKQSHIIITNIEMLLYLMETDQLAFLKEATLVLDEVHTIITWGEAFRSSYKRIGEVIAYLKPKEILSFTATLDDYVCSKIVNEIFSGRTPYIVHASSDRANIFYQRVDALSIEHEIISILKNDKNRPALVFAKSRKKAEELNSFISKYFASEYYHAGLEREEKEKKEHWFISSEDGVMVATIAFGMGVDKKNIRSVIHSYIPSSPFSFIQEAGRAGRDGNASTSFILRDPTEIVSSSFSEIFLTKNCIRSFLLKAMGEEREERMCLSCSNCKDDVYRRAGEREILNYIRKHPFKLKNDTEFALAFSVFLKKKNKLYDWNCKEIRKAIDILVSEGYINSNKWSYRLTKSGKQRLQSINIC